MKVIKNLTKEIPVVIFFIYLAYLSWWFQEREHQMLDYALNFDHWWYFYHQLREGTLAQWNPFSLFGRIAVQYNYIPVSALFSPFFILMEPTLKLYHNFQVASVFLGVAGIYVFGRILGYGRYAPLLPMALILLCSSYKYWISFIYFAAFFFLYPLSIAVFVRASEKKILSNFQWLLFITVFSLSLLGLRLEKTIYAMTFVSIMIFSFSIKFWGDWQKMRHFVLSGIIALAGVLALIAWQLPFLFTSALTTDRVAIGFNLANVLNIELWRWIFLSIILQKILLLAVLNLSIAIALKYSRRVNLRFDIRPAFFIIAAELMLFYYASEYLYAAKSHLFPHIGALMTDLHMLNEKKVDVLFSSHGIIALLLCLILFFIREKKVSGVRFFSLLAAIFAGFYVADYSWQYWQIGNSVFNYFWPPAAASFIALGAVSLWSKKKTWMLVTLLIFHLVAETGSIFLYDVFGYPWLPGRAALAEIPFQVLLLLEAFFYFINSISHILKILFSRINIGDYVKPLASLVIYMLIFINMKTMLIPGQKVTIGNRQAYKASEMFPFAETVLYPFESNKGKNQWLAEALQNAEKVKQAGRQNNPWKRVYVSDSVHSWGPMYYKFLPAYSQTLNTAPVYASEIPKAMRDIFRHDDKQIINLHYEVNPLVLAYFANKWEEKGSELSGRHLDFVGMTFLPTHASNDALYKELMAEEGSNTVRAFLSANVVKVKQQNDEYRYLKEIMANGGSVMNCITTSDPAFNEDKAKSNLPLQSKLEFLKDEPEHIVFSSHSNRNAYLALLDLYNPGWRAYVDGIETAIYRGYIGLRFVAVPEGTHRVEFKYRVPYLLVGLILSFCGWAAVIAMFLRRYFKKEKCMPKKTFA